MFDLVDVFGNRGALLSDSLQRGIKLLPGLGIEDRVEAVSPLLTEVFAYIGFDVDGTEAMDDVGKLRVGKRQVDNKDDG